MQSKATSPDQYLNELPKDRKEAVTLLRNITLKSLPKGFEETMQYGMLSYVVPHSIYPKGYHCKPTDALPFFSIASQKSSINIYHIGLYMDKTIYNWFVAEYPKYSNAKIDMGKSCIRFKKTEQIPIELIGELLSKITVDQWIKMYEKQLNTKK